MIEFDTLALFWLEVLQEPILAMSALMAAVSIAAGIMAAMIRVFSGNE
jgi:hypothetical protein